MLESRITVSLPTATGSLQTLHGRTSNICPELEEFRGIPYGIVPGRWQHSSIRDSLPDDVFDASSNGPRCPQPESLNTSEGGFGINISFPVDVQESEFECLNLFVVRPGRQALERHGLDSGEPLPVCIWIHGGGYGFGAATDPMWDPSRLVQQSLHLGTPFIAVSINYRLGIFGFGGCSEILDEQVNDKLRGLNFGLRDQKVALEWISRNIRAFNGNAYNMTIAGQSAGSHSVHVHTLEAKYRAERPLFRNAIMQSGAIGCLGPIHLDEADKHWDLLCSKLTGPCTVGELRLFRMRAKSASEVLEACWSLEFVVFPIINDTLTITCINPSEVIHVDLGRVSQDVEAAEDISTPITVMISQASKEGSLHSIHVDNITSHGQLYNMARPCFSTDVAFQSFLQFYTPSEALEGQLTRFLTETHFAYGIDCAGKMLDDPFSKMTHPTQVKLVEFQFGNPFLGPLHGIAHHCVDLIYLFDAFYEALARLDDMKSRPRTPDNPATTTNCPSPSYRMSRTDSGYGSRPHTPGHERNVSGGMKTNSSLRDTVQGEWIDFITRDHTLEDKEQYTSKTVIRYGADRTRKVVSVAEDLELSHQQARFTTIKESYDDMRRALRTITSSVLF